MKSLIFTVLVCFWANNLTAQDITPGHTVSMDYSVATRYAEPGQSAWFSHANFFCQFQAGDFYPYVFIKDIGYQSLPLQPQGSLNFSVDSPDGEPQAVITNGDTRQNLTSLGLGLNWGNDNFRLYAGPGYSLDNKVRVNFGAFYKYQASKFDWQSSFFVDAAEADVRYNFKSTIGGQLPDTELKMRIGLYSHFRLGTGFLGEVTYSHFTFKSGWGYQLGWSKNQASRLWAGVGLAL